MACCCPPEILNNILEQLTRSDLSNTLTVNRAFLSTANRILYRSLHSLRPFQSIHLLKALVTFPSNRTTLVRRLDLDWTKYQYALPCLFRLLHAVLLSLPNLKSLSLEFGQGTNERENVLSIFEGVGFKLEALSISVTWGEPLIEFLSAQDEIKELYLRGFDYREPYSLTSIPCLPEGSLPYLTSLQTTYTSPALLHLLVTNRLIDSVSLSLFECDGFAALDVLRADSSLVPVRTLAVLDFFSFQSGSGRSSARRRVKSLLGAIQERGGEHLERLSIVCSNVVVPKESLEGCAEVLREFKVLKELTVVVARISSSVPSLPSPPGTSVTVEFSDKNKPLGSNDKNFASEIVISSPNSKLSEVETNETNDGNAVRTGTRPEREEVQELGVARLWAESCVSLRRVVIGNCSYAC